MPRKLKVNDLQMMRTFELTPVTLQVLTLLMDLPLVPTEIIQENISVGTKAKLAVWRLRMSLEPFGVKIHSRRSAGYWIDDDGKRIIRSMMPDHKTELPREVMVT